VLRKNLCVVKTRSNAILSGDAAAGYREVASSPELRGNEWTVNRPLTRGRLYTWQVTARLPGGEVKAPAPQAGEARFRVLQQSKADEIAEAERTQAGRHLALAVIYAQAGLLDEAERELTALAAANPNSDLPRKLLSKVRVQLVPNR
jgi:hypothetical protein